MHKPKISVVVPVYNGRKFLEPMLNSLLAQTFTDFELIVVNDGSTDDTAEILGRYAKRDCRLVVHHQDNQGQVPSMRTGIDMARAELIARIDADDIAFPRRFERQVEYLDTHPEVVMVGGRAIIIDQCGLCYDYAHYPTSPWACREKLTTKGNCFSHSVVTFRRHAYYACGGYQSRFAPAEDYDLFLRLSEVGEVVNLDSTEVANRYHPDNMSLSNGLTQTLRAVSAMYSHYLRSHGSSDVIFEHIDCLRSTSIPAIWYGNMVTAGLGLLNYYVKESTRILASSNGLRLCQDALDFATKLGTQEQVKDLVLSYPIAAYQRQRSELVAPYLRWLKGYQRIPNEYRSEYHSYLSVLLDGNFGRISVDITESVTSIRAKSSDFFLDIVSRNVDGIFLEFIGWARCAVHEPMHFMLTAPVSIYIGQAERQRRPDVVEHHRDTSLTWSGFRVLVILNEPDVQALEKISLYYVDRSGRP